MLIMPMISVGRGKVITLFLANSFMDFLNESFTL